MLLREPGQWALSQNIPVCTEQIHAQAQAPAAYLEGCPGLRSKGARLLTYPGGTHLTEGPSKSLGS